MRILHSSDWHLGRHFGPESLLPDQASFVDWFIGQVSEQDADLVVIAGDVFDRAIPPTEAITLYTSALRRLAEAGGKVAIIAGNHDGPERLALYDSLLDLSGIFVRGGYSNIGEVIRLEMSDGPLDLVLLPFLEPQAAPDSLASVVVGASDTAAPTTVVAASSDSDDASDPDDSAARRRQRRTHESVLAAAVAAVAPALSAPRSIAVAHAFVTGGTTSESERQLSVGGTSTVSGDVFAPFSYTALGHLHTPQPVGAPTLRYSGTPLAYSFSETAAKSITVVDMSPTGECEVSTIAVPVGRAAVTVTGRIDELLEGEATAEQSTSWVRAILTDPGVVLDAKSRLQTKFPFVVEVELRPEGLAVGPDGEPVADVRTLTAEQAIATFWEEAQGAPPTEAETEWLHKALAAARAKAEVAV